MEQHFTVRDFENGDYESVMEVWKQTNMGGAARGDNLEVINRTLANHGKLFVLVDTSTQLLMGTAWITNDTRRLYLHHFGILPEFQGKGFSHLLMKRIMEFVDETNMQIKLEVHKDNTIAQKLYSDYGFNYLGDYNVLIIRK